MPDTDEQKRLAAAEDEKKQLAAADQNREAVAAYVKEEKVNAELAAWLVANNVLIVDAKVLCEQHKAQGCCFPEGGPRFGEAPPKVVVAAAPAPPASPAPTVPKKVKEPE